MVFIYNVFSSIDSVSSIPCSSTDFSMFLRDLARYFKTEVTETVAKTPRVFEPIDTVLTV
jgi:hypothetical protein